MVPGRLGQVKALHLGRPRAAMGGLSPAMPVAPSVPRSLGRDGKRQDKKQSAYLHRFIHPYDLSSIYLTYPPTYLAGQPASHVAS